MKCQKHGVEMLDVDGKLECPFCVAELFDVSSDFSTKDEQS